VPGILTALFVSTLGQVIIEWIFAFMCFAGTTATRLDIFYQSLGIGSTPIEEILSTVLQGVGQMLANYLLVLTFNDTLHHINPVLFRFGAVGMSYLRGHTLDWRLFLSTLSK